MSDIEETKLMIQDCINRQSFMTEWEVNFIFSIEDNDHLTKRQLDTLERIWEKVTA